jgi:hypothetical protein
MDHGHTMSNLWHVNRLFGISNFLAQVRLEMREPIFFVSCDHCRGRVGTHNVLAARNSRCLVVFLHLYMHHHHHIYIYIYIYIYHDDLRYYRGTPDEAVKQDTIQRWILG